MPALSVLSAGVYSDVAVCINQDLTPDKDRLTEERCLIAFSNPNNFIRISEIFKIFDVGNSVTVTSVPSYGQWMSQQVAVQGGDSALELEINYIPSLWKEGSILKTWIGSEVPQLIRVAILDSRPNGYASAPESMGGLGDTQNSQYFFLGNLTGLRVLAKTQSANTGILNIIRKSDMYGPYSNDNIILDKSKTFSEEVSVFDIKNIYVQNYFLSPYVSQSYLGVKYAV